MFTLVHVNLVIILSKMSLQATMVQHDLTGILLSQNKNKADSNLKIFHAQNQRVDTGCPSEMSATGNFSVAKATLQSQMSVSLSVCPEAKPLFILHPTSYILHLSLFINYPSFRDF